MPTRKHITRRANRISFKHDRRVFIVTIEGGIALLMIGVVAVAYISQLFR